MAAEPYARVFALCSIYAREPAKPGGGTDHYKYDRAASGSILIANNLYTLSNKSTGGSIASNGLINDLYGLVSQVLNHVPPEKRDAAIKTILDFLGERIELPDTREQIDARLRQHMQYAAQENPWFKDYV